MTKRAGRDRIISGCLIEWFLYRAMTYVFSYLIYPFLYPITSDSSERITSNASISCHAEMVCYLKENCYLYLGNTPSRPHRETGAPLRDWRILEETKRVFTRSNGTRTEEWNSFSKRSVRFPQIFFRQRSGVIN